MKKNKAATKTPHRARKPRSKPRRASERVVDGLALAAALLLGTALGRSCGHGGKDDHDHAEVSGNQRCAACGHERRDHCFCGRECLAPGEACKCQGFVETAVVEPEVPQMFDGPGSTDDLMMRLWEVAEPVVGPVLDALGIRRRPS